MSDEYSLRTERDDDQAAVDHILRTAFGQPDEAELVSRLRQSDAFIPELSIVAIDGGRIVGYILFTRISITKVNSDNQSLALAPVAVDPGKQSDGIGSMLIEFGLQRCRELGHGSVIVLGHVGYYPRFGFQPAAQWNITCPFPVPSENFMAIELVPGALEGVNGVVRYAPEFG